MSDGHVTITLGRSGQKVVKRSRRNGGGGGGGGAQSDSQTFSGSKRSSQNTFERSSDGSLSFSSKRLRGDDTSRSSGRNSLGGARIGQEDLRLKLMRKRMSQSQGRIETREKTSRAVHSSEQSLRSSVSSIPLARNSNELQRMDLLRSNYSSRTSIGLPPKFPDTIVKASAGISAAKYIDEIPRVPSARRVEPSETQRVVRGDVGLSRSTGPVPMPMRPNLIARLPVREVPTISSMARSTQPDASPLTVSSFLHSLGLGKYAINFQAEEVDMIALKQMGDRDLKELGLPMGPRKKILLAMLPPSSRPTK